MAPREATGEVSESDGTRKREAPLPRVLIYEENPAHLELDLLGLVPVVGEPADLLNAVIYAWERDWENAAISVAAVAPVAGSAGTLARIAERTNGMPGPVPRLTQEVVDHIVARHWWSAGTGARAGKFAADVTLPMLTGMVDAALRHGRMRPNVSGAGLILEVDLVRIIGVNGSGRLTSRLRVVLDEFGEILTAFPY